MNAYRELTTGQGRPSVDLYRSTRDSSESEVSVYDISLIELLTWMT